MPFVVVKRRHPRLGDTYGHWWVELDGAESFGWWPDPCPVPLRSFLRGTGGTLNGLGGTGGGTATRDPMHGEPADDHFHPVAVDARSDDEVRKDLRRFASAHRGPWRWSARAGADCRSFQLGLLAAAGLAEPAEAVLTRGYGCPFLLPARQGRARVRSMLGLPSTPWVRTIVPLAIHDPRAVQPATPRGVAT